MVPTQHQRGTCLGLAIWLTLSRFWWTMTSERFKRLAAEIAFWVLAVGLVAMLYTWASFECALREECTFASAHWANWLFDK